MLLQTVFVDSVDMLDGPPGVADDFAEERRVELVGRDRLSIEDEDFAEHGEPEEGDDFPADAAASAGTKKDVRRLFSKSRVSLRARSATLRAEIGPSGPRPLPAGWLFRWQLGQRAQPDDDCEKAGAGDGAPPLLVVKLRNWESGDPIERTVIATLESHGRSLNVRVKLRRPQIPKLVRYLLTALIQS